MKRATGLRRAATRATAYDPKSPASSTAASLGPPAAISYPIQQRIARIIDQAHLPACVGCTMCAGAEVAVGSGQRLSWVRIWTDARRRDGTLKDDSAGTWFTSAIASVMLRGLDPEEPGEWNRIDEMLEPDDLASELAADDRRQVGAEHWRVPDGDIDALLDALARGLTVGIAAGVRDPYYDFFRGPRSASQLDVVLTSAALGGNRDGHEQRLIGVERNNGIRSWIIQNSWGHNGGCHLPDGTFQLGCAKVDDTVIRAAWDIDCIHLRAKT